MARLRRARRVAEYLHANQDQYLRDLQMLTVESHVGTDMVAAHVAKRLEQLRAKRAADTPLDKAKFETTDMIRQAAKDAFTGRADLIEEAVLAWRSTSGAAHGLQWPLFGTAGTVQAGPADEKGVAEFHAGGSLDRIANAYMAAFRLGECAWKLLRNRGAAPQGGPDGE